MKTLFVLLALASSVFGQGVHRVREYVKKDGTVVAPHWQTNPNGTKADNFTERGLSYPAPGSWTYEKREEARALKIAEINRQIKLLEERAFKDPKTAAAYLATYTDSPDPYGVRRVLARDAMARYEAYKARTAIR